MELLKQARVIDLADEKAAFCTRLLADLGAIVTKVERPGGDPSRRRGPFLENDPSPEKSLSFWYSNGNKRGITLDIERNEGKQIFFKLVKSTDVIVETFPPGHLDKLGLGYDTLKEVNSALILASVTGFGQNDPRSPFKWCDLVAAASGGQMSVCGAPSTPPLKHFGEQSFYLASLFSAIAILLALRKRGRSGRGNHIDISAQECVASTLDHVLVRYFYDEIIAKRSGSVSWNGSSFILPCKNGHIHLNIATQWETLVEWMASEGMAEDLGDEKWKEDGYRFRNLEHVIHVLQKWTQTHSAEDLFQLGQSMRFPWAPVCSPENVLNSPQLKARGFFTGTDHPEAGTPYRFNPQCLWEGSTERKQAPRMGEDNLKIYRDELGLSNTEIEGLSSLKII